MDVSIMQGPLTGPPALTLGQFNLGPHPSELECTDRQGGRLMAANFIRSLIPQERWLLNEDGDHLGQFLCRARGNRPLILQHNGHRLYVIAIYELA